MPLRLNTAWLFLTRIRLFLVSWLFNVLPSENLNGESVPTGEDLQAVLSDDFSIFFFISLLGTVTFTPIEFLLNHVDLWLIRELGPWSFRTRDLNNPRVDLGIKGREPAGRYSRRSNCQWCHGWLEKSTFVEVYETDIVVNSSTLSWSMDNGWPSLERKC